VFDLENNPPQNAIDQEQRFFEKEKKRGGTLGNRPQLTVPIKREETLKPKGKQETGLEKVPSNKEEESMLGCFVGVNKKQKREEATRRRMKGGSEKNT